MSYVLPLTTKEVERRLLKIADLAVHPAIYDESKALIQVVIDHFIEDGSEIKFKAPVDCSAITKLRVQYTDELGAVTSKVFAFADANGNDVGEISNLFAAGTIVKVVLDLDADANGTYAAFVQNADTNAYLETKLASKAQVQIITWEDDD